MAVPLERVVGSSSATQVVTAGRQRTVDAGQRLVANRSDHAQVDLVPIGLRGDDDVLLVQTIG